MRCVVFVFVLLIIPCVRIDFEKTERDVEEIFNLFRDFVFENRPQLDMDKVATGETWFGTAALERNLCDEIKTVDDVIVDYISKGFNVFEVAYSPPIETFFGKLVPARAKDGLMGMGVKWLVRTIAAEIKAELGSYDAAPTYQTPLEQRYVARDDTADRTKVES
jgi:ClpP class serine protease